MAEKKKKKSVADSIINGTYEKQDLFSSKNKKSVADSIINGSYNAKDFFPSSTKSTTTKKDEEIAPVKQEKKRTWFNSGAFSDGYQFGDVTKTILGTSTDVREDLAKGLYKIGEGVIDTGAYLLGGGAKLIGQDKFADSMKDFTKRNLVEENKMGERFANSSATGMINNLLNGNYKALNPFNKEAKDDNTYIEGNSLLGDRSDSLVQSGGQLAGTIGLQAVGVPWWVTTGVTSFGGETEQAFQKDATYGEAGFSGLVTAGAEILTEKLSGGISFGGKTLDDVMLKPLTEKITNKTLKTLTNFGIDAAGEGLEEVASSVIQKVGQKLSYEDEQTWSEILTSEEALDEYLESFIGGAVLGGGSSVVNSIQNRTTLNKQEQIENLEKTVDTKETEELKAPVQQQLELEDTNAQQITDKTYYHGTRGDFDTFDNSKIGQNYEGDWSSLGKGFYFTNDSDSAKKFGESSINEGEVTVKEAKLDIKKPFYVDDFTKNDKQTIDSIKEKYELGDIANGYNLIDALKKKGLDSTEVLKESGYDGIVAEDEVMVFDASQINMNKQETKVEEVAPNTVQDAPMQDTQEQEIPIQGLESYSNDEIKTLTNDYVQQKLEENGIYDVTIKDAAIHGSRGRGTARPDSDLDVVVEFEGDIREDDLFSILNEEPMYIDGVQVDINPINANNTGTLKDYMERSKAYDKEVLSKQEKENVQKEVQKKTDTPTQQEIDNLLDIQKNKSGSEYASAFYDLKKKYGDANLYKALNEENSRQKNGTKEVVKQVEEVIKPLQETVEKLAKQLADMTPASQEAVEQQRQDSIDSLINEEAPLQSGLTEREQQEKDMYDEHIEQNGIESLGEEDRKRYAYLQGQNVEEINTDETKVKDPLEDRNIEEVGDRKVKAYQYENPEVRPYFQEEAKIMLQELSERLEGKRYPIIGTDGYTDHWAGQPRVLVEDIAQFKDEYKLKYSDIEKGLNNIIKDDGAENNAVSKRLEFLINDRLLKGYTTVEGYQIPPNQEYVNFLKAKQITEYTEEAYKEWQKSLETIEPSVEIAPEPQKQAVEQPKTEVKEIAPSTEKVAQNENTDVPETKQRSWVKTSTESEVVNGEISIEDLDNVTYEVKSNKKSLDTANSKLDRYGYNQAVDYVNSKLMDKKISVEDIVLGERLIQEALKKGDKKTAAELIENVSILGTELGQKIQALSIIQKLRPEGQLRVLEKVVQRGKTKGDKVFENVQITQEMKDKILSVVKPDGTYDQLVLNEVVEQVKQKIADQMETTFWDKANAWRYLAMLGNPKTHIRNLISNVAMKGTTAVKNVMARTIEDVTSAVAPTKIKERTKTWKDSSKDVLEYADKTTLEVKKVLNDESSFSEDTSIKSKRQMFKTKILEKIYNFNSDMLTKEDWWFKKSAFKNSFAEYLTANGIETKDDIKNNYKIVEKAKLYAMEQAQIATFSQMSYLANKINEIENKNIAGKIIVGSTMPFKRTPINIAKTGLAYSPLGFAKTLTVDRKAVKEGNMEASQLIDNIAKNTTGSALMLVGYMLAQAGFLNGGGEDDKEGKYDSQLGDMVYSIKIGDTSYSLSWLSPVAMPLFIGANAYEKLIEKEEWNTDVVINTLAQTLDPLSEMSFLSGLTQVLSSYETGSMEQIKGMVESIAQNYVGQFAPTVLSQVAGTLDDTKRTTTETSASGNKFINTTINKLKYKIPGLRETLEPSLDIWGNEVKQADTVGQRAIDNFIAPYSKKKDITTQVDTELKEVYRETGENSVLPTSSISSNLDYKNEKYKMTNEEYTDFKKKYGQTAYEMLEELFETDTYAESDNTEKAKLISNVYEYARDVSKKEYFDKHEVEYTNTTEDNIPVYKEKPIKKAIEYDMTPEEYSYFEENPAKYKTITAITDYETYKTYSKDIYDLKGDKDRNGKTISNSRKVKVFDYINGLDLGFEQKVMLAKMEYPSYDEYNYEIIDYLNNNNSIDYDTMESILLELGFKVDANGNINW
jgi:predicted nucleotidyltransferase